MELGLIESFSFSNVTDQLIGDVDALAARVNEFRPLAKDIIAAVHQKLFAERVHSSNAIEGNTLTLRETIEILRTGHVSTKKREGTEAINLGEAVKYLDSVLLPSANPFSVDHLLAEHATLLKGIHVHAGQFRTDRVKIGGATYQPPRHDLVPTLVQQIIESLAKNENTVNPVKLAAWAHWSLARVHPFFDGNGRIARLWQDLVLLRARLAPAIIRLQDRDQNGYYDALAAGDKGDLNPLTQLIAQRTAATLEQYIAAQQQTSELTDWATRIAGEAGIRAAEERKARYLQWSRVMESLRNDFQRCAAKITSSGIEVQFRAYPLIDQVAWENIRTGIGVERTWFFTLGFRRENKSFVYFFFFGKHFWTPEDNTVERNHPRVALLISEQTGPEKAKRLAEIPDCPVNLREIFAVDRQLTAVNTKRGASPDAPFEYDRTSSGVVLAQQFIEQVLLQRIF